MNIMIIGEVVENKSIATSYFFKSAENVGLSRAQTLSIVVGDPRTALNSPNSVGEMACLSFLAKLST